MNLSRIPEEFCKLRGFGINRVKLHNSNVANIAHFFNSLGDVEKQSSIAAANRQWILRGKASHSRLAVPVRE